MAMRNVIGRPRDFVLRIASNSNAGTNLYTASVAAGYNDKRRAAIVINAGVSLGAPDTSTPGVKRGAFPSGVKPFLRVLGNIYGFGGAGGPGGTNAAGTNGSGGGPALQSTDGSMFVDNQGTIKSGGGGGGGGGGDAA